MTYNIESNSEEDYDKIRYHDHADNQYAWQKLR